VDGYATCARIERARPRFVVAGPGFDGPSRAPSGVAESALADHRPVELVGVPLDERLAQWLAGVRETWSQTTFFLFDPESWR